MAKKRKNSRQKGAAFERQIAKSLSEWWGIKFHRTPLSGGLSWGADNRVIGDIVAPMEGGDDFPFTVECKKHEGWDLDTLLKDTGPIKDWWKQAITDNKRLNDESKHPLLLFSRNYSPVFYMMYQKTWEKLNLENTRYFITKLYGVEREDDVHPVVVGLLDDLVKISKEEVIKSL